jgi:hypothetical protein
MLLRHKALQGQVLGSQGLGGDDSQGAVRLWGPWVPRCCAVSEVKKGCALSLKSRPIVTAWSRPREAPQRLVIAPSCPTVLPPWHAA